MSLEKINKQKQYPNMGGGVGGFMPLGRTARRRMLWRPHPLTCCARSMQGAYEAQSRRFQCFVAVFDYGSRSQGFFPVVEDLG